MGYQITVYGNDVGILKTTVERYEWSTHNLVAKKEVEYGDTVTLTAFEDEYVFIECTLASGYDFDCWAYRLGSINPDEDAEISYRYPFEYYDTQNLYIRATSYKIDTPEDDTWNTEISYFQWPVDSTGSSTFNLSPGTLRVYGVEFSKNGIATFHVESSMDTIGWLTLGTGDDYYNPGASEPHNSLVMDDDSYDGNDFQFTHEVSAGITYYVWIRGANWDTSGSGRFVVENASTSVPIWTWYYSNGSATDVETRDSYEALKTGTPTTDFSYKVWNDIVSKVSAILDYQDDGWDRTYATLTNTKMSTSDKKLTAVRYNSVVKNIDWFIKNTGHSNGTGIPFVDPGDVVFCSHITQLTDEINRWIPEL